MRLKRSKPLLSCLGAVLLVSAAPVFLRAQKKAAQKTSHKAAPSATSHTSSAGKHAAGAGTRKVSGKRSKTRRRERAQKAPTAERISEIQAALAREGTYQGEPSGKWDAATVEAMKRFQAANGLNPSGKLGALSLQKLGLGSEVAGRAAPRPLATPSASSTPISR